MKLEVDLNDRNQLIKMETELSTALEIIRSALSVHESKNDQVAASIQPDGYQMVHNAIATLPQEFNSSAIYEPMLASGMVREAVKAAIGRLVEERVIQVHVAGKGRRPTVYRKGSM